MIKDVKHLVWMDYKKVDPNEEGRYLVLKIKKDIVSIELKTWSKDPSFRSGSGFLTCDKSKIKYWAKIEIPDLEIE